MAKLNETIDRVQTWNRTRKVHQFLEHCRTEPTDTTLDVGFAPTTEPGIRNALQNIVTDHSTMTALTIEDPEPARESYPDLRIVQYDGGIMPFADNEFDTTWSNAVVEHVGDEATRIEFVSEMCRVGESVMFTTPNKYFPVEVHTRMPLLHILLPKAAFDWVLHRVGCSWATGSYMHLMGKRELANLVKKAGVDNAIIIHNRLGPFTMDFSVIIPKTSA